ncbi:MAG: N-Acetylneuraminate cytidylyltransferase [Candidatus Ruthia sp. Asou_11_S2]|nr:N-Acetylneuraminate cytidylyltransferase [Candidatus Ruthia sp. Asou_11_S2]
MNIAFIPVRCGSQSIAFKNIKELNGKPLIYWALLAVVNSKHIDKVYVATDCKEIKSAVSHFNFSKVSLYDRDKENASNSASTEDVMLEFLDKKKFSNDDLFLLIQATSPFTTAEDIDLSIDKLQKSNADSLLSCAVFKRFLWDKNGKALNYNYQYRPRRQDFSGNLIENGAIYISSVGNVKKYKNRLSGKIEIYEMLEHTMLELDEPDDWLIVEQLMKKYADYQKPKNKIKLFLSDVDGTLTDAGMYYGENGEEFKKFSTHDGKGFELLKNVGIKTGIITSEKTKIVENRARKLKVDYLYQGVEHGEKLQVVKEICKIENITLDEVAYAGDDINDRELLEKVSVSACPKNAVDAIKCIPNIIQLKRTGGYGAVREFIEIILKRNNGN